MCLVGVLFTRSGFCRVAPLFGRQGRYSFDVRFPVTNSRSPSLLCVIYSYPLFFRGSLFIWVLFGSFFLSGDALFVFSWLSCFAQKPCPSSARSLSSQFLSFVRHTLFPPCTAVLRKCSPRISGYIHLLYVFTLGLCLNLILPGYSHFALCCEGRLVGAY